MRSHKPLIQFVVLTCNLKLRGGGGWAGEGDRGRRIRNSRLFSSSYGSEVSLVYIIRPFLNKAQEQNWVPGVQYMFIILVLRRKRNQELWNLLVIPSRWINDLQIQWETCLKLQDGKRLRETLMWPSCLHIQTHICTCSSIHLYTHTSIYTYTPGGGDTFLRTRNLVAYACKSSPQGFRAWILNSKLKNKQTKQSNKQNS